MRGPSSAFGLGAALLAFVGCGGSAQSSGSATGGAGASEEGGSSSATGGSGGAPAAGGTNSSGGTGTGTGGAKTSGTGGAKAGGTGGASSTGTGGKSSSSTGGVSSGGSSATTGGTGSIDPAHPTAQLDILLMVDNSLSMADKQAVLADAVPLLLTRLTTPYCLDASGALTGMKASSDGKCAAGSPEFSPVNDIHVGVVTSSLGAHGSQTCAAAETDDKGQLIGKLRPDPTFPYQTWNDSGFLAWDPGGRSSPPGESNVAVFATGLRNMILSANQIGCGFEASLEAWYRFLIDPDPPTLVPQASTTSQVTTPVVPADPAQNPVLVQRAAFLRPDSALVIVMLSDENDCSIRDEGQGWLVGQQATGGAAFRMPRATSVCETNPNDKCCASCASTAPAGCAAPSSDPACASGNLMAIDDNLNLRCWDQKRRFGADFLYPLTRYVDGLTQPTVTDRSGKLVANPLFPAGGRTPSMVFLTGIVGVPWQDLATEASLQGAGLEYLSHQELTAQGRWPLVLGSTGDATTPPTPPGDKLMVETTLDRTTVYGNAPHPLINSALASANATGQPNPINGHESNITDKGDLQYACIFPLPVAKDCAAGAAACDCKVTDAAFNRAVCNGTTQTHAKAYPGVRELRVLKDFGDRTGNAITASICPKTLSDASSVSYGYNPAFSALVRSLKPVLMH